MNLLEALKIGRQIGKYRKLLFSNKYFTKEEYEYFGGRIYELRKLLKDNNKKTPNR